MLLQRAKVDVPGVYIQPELAEPRGHPLLCRGFSAAQAFDADQGRQVGDERVTIDSVQHLGFTRGQHLVIVNQLVNQIVTASVLW